MKKHFRSSEEYKQTTNRSTFNKLHKRMLERKGKIHCSYCEYHRGENDGIKYYGEIRRFSCISGEKKYSAIQIGKSHQRKKNNG